MMNSTGTRVVAVEQEWEDGCSIHIWVDVDGTLFISVKDEKDVEVWHADNFPREFVHLLGEMFGGEWNRRQCEGDEKVHGKADV